MNTEKYIVKRVLSIIPVLLGTSVLIFSLIHLAPGDPAITIAGLYADETVLAQIRKNLGLDLPLYQQYFRWLSNVIRGNLGVSAINRRPVLDVILKSFPLTLLLALFAMFLAIVISIPMGIITAYRRNSIIDQIFRGFTIGGISMPRYWLALIVIWYVGLQLKILPPGGYTPIAENFIGGIKSLALPVFTLAMAPISRITRLTRASMLDVLNTDYIKTARGKGLKESTILIRHALRNALIPVLTLSGMEIAYLLAGAVIVERIFFLPGMGRMLIDSVNNRDYQLIQGILLFTAVIFTISNLIVDLLYNRINPRLRH